MWSAKEARCVPAKYWEIIADNLKKAGWSLGWVLAIDSERQTIWIVDAPSRRALETINSS